MHILFVFEDFCLGGVERVSEQLIKGLTTLYDCRVSIICEDHKGELSERFSDIGNIYNLNGRNKLLYFNSICKRLRPDLIVFTKGGLAKYSVLLPKYIRAITIQHVPINLPEKNVIKNTFRRWGARILYKKIQHIVCVSSGILDNLVKLNIIPKSKGSCIYNPVLDHSINLKAQEDVEYHDYFVCVGRLHFQKGYDLLIESVIEAKKQIDNLKVVIIGDGPEYDNLKKNIATNHLTNNIIIHGSSDNPYKYIKHAKGILLPSRWEGLPTVLVEAAYLATPIITFDCLYGPRELTQNGNKGILVEYSDTKAFAACIIQLNNNEISPPPPSVENFFLPAATNHYYSLFKSLI